MGCLQLFESGRHFWPGQPPFIRDLLESRSLDDVVVRRIANLHSCQPSRSGRDSPYITVLPSPDVPPAVAGMPVLSHSGSRAGFECAHAPTQHGPGE